MSDDLPDEMIDRIPALEAAVKSLLVPADTRTVMVLLDRLFAQLPMPTKAGMELWRKEMERYPVDLLEDAVMQIIRTHRWETPPKIAQLVDALKDEWNERNGWHLKLRAAKLKLRISPPLPKPRSEKDMVSVRVTQEQMAELRKRFPNAFPPAPNHSEVEERQRSLDAAGHEGNGDE